MIDREKPAVATVPVPPPTAGAAPTAPIPPKRSPGHRGADVKDTVAEMAAKAHEISLEAGSKMAAAMKDVIGAAAGLTGLVLESARDLLQYMVRRGQMTQEEADKLMREVPLVMPKMSMTMTEGTFLVWRREPGDAIKAGDVICGFVSGEVDMEVNDVLEQSDLDEGLILGCQARPKSDSVEVTYDE